MIDDLPERLEKAATAEHAAAMRRQIRCLRGIRGVANGDLARIAAAAWKVGKAKLPDDEDMLSEWFGGAFEDGIVAIGFLAACVPDSPAEALDIGISWLDRVDDVLTADALGWLVLGPAALASARSFDALIALRDSTPETCRAAVIAGMSAVPESVEGPAAAPLRERVGQKHVMFVEQALSVPLAALADAYVRDDEPAVRKGLRRVVHAWAAADPESAQIWVEEVRGGCPKVFRAEVDTGARKAARRAR